MTDKPNIKNDDRPAGGVKLLRAFIRGERNSLGDHWQWSFADNALDDVLDELAALRQRCEQREEQLAECFRVSGGDTDGDNYAPRLADRAVQAVRDLRRDYDEACGELDSLP